MIGAGLGGALAGINAPSAPAAPGAPAPEAGPLSGLGINAPTSQIMKNVGAIGMAGIADKALNTPAAKDTSTPTGPTIAPQVAGIYQPSSTGGSSPSNPLGGLGNIGYAEGGHVPLKNGAYIIPADVVSALGNGSSKAGAEFLQRLMAQVKQEAIKRQGVGAAKAYAA